MTQLSNLSGKILNAEPASMKPPRKMTTTYANRNRMYASSGGALNRRRRRALGRLDGGALHRDLRATRVFPVATLALALALGLEREAVGRTRRTVRGARALVARRARERGAAGAADRRAETRGHGRGTARGNAHRGSHARRGRRRALGARRGARAGRRGRPREMSHRRHHVSCVASGAGTRARRSARGGDKRRCHVTVPQLPPPVSSIRDRAPAVGSFLSACLLYGQTP